MVDKIKIEYPNVDDEELIKILNDENIDAKRENILNKYGIDDSKLSIKALEQQERNILLYNIGILFVTALLLLGTFYLYLKNRKKELKVLFDEFYQLAEKKDKKALAKGRAIVYNTKRDREDYLRKS